MTSSEKLPRYNKSNEDPRPKQGGEDNRANTKLQQERRLFRSSLSALTENES